MAGSPYPGDEDWQILAKKGRAGQGATRGVPENCEKSGKTRGDGTGRPFRVVPATSATLVAAENLQTQAYK